MIQKQLQENGEIQRAKSPDTTEEGDLRNAALRSRKPQDTGKARLMRPPKDLSAATTPAMGDVRSRAQQTNANDGTQQEKSPHGEDDINDLRDVINCLRHKGRPQIRDHSKTRGRDEPSSRGMDPDEHRTRRHKYDTNPPPDKKRNRTPYRILEDDKTQEQMLRWLSKDPTRIADAQRDVARWKDRILFVAMTYGNRGLRP